MRRYLGRISAMAACALLASTAAPAQGRKPAAPEPFTFLEITDTLQTSQASAEALRLWAQQTAAMSPKPAFVIATGNITETGRPDEYARFKEAIAPLDSAGIKFYAVPGNHDVRWSPTGKEEFARQFGKTYQSFDYNGVHFVLLDSTVLLEHWGHFDRTELDWLTHDLKRVRTETPVLLFFHHWVGRDTPVARMIDNEYDLIPILRGHNVVAMFNGHGNEDLAWQTNGIETLMARGLYQGSYYRVDVSGSLVSIDRYTREKEGQASHVVTLPVAGKAHPSALKVGWDDPDNPYLVRRRPSATLDPRAFGDNPDSESAQYRVDDAANRPMTKDPRDIWQDQFPTGLLPIGIHTVDIHLTTSGNVTYSDELIFEVERDSREPTRKWAINFDNSIQSSPLRVENTLYVSSLDGRLHALDVQTGKQRWAFGSKGPMVATPTVADGMLYVGSMDHYLYALNAETGRQVWRFDTGSPVFAGAGVTQGVVCLGSAGRILGLDARTGSLRWSQPSTGFFQSRAAAGPEAFYLGGWNSTVFALDALTGAPRWTVKMGKALAYSPAISSPAPGEGRLYICSNDGVLHALDMASGKEVWNIFAPQGEDPFGYSSPVLIGSTLYLAGLGSRGDVYAVDAATGAIRWRTPTGQPIYDSSPHVAPDGLSLAIMGVRGHLAVLATDSGRSLWSYELGPGNIFSSPEYDGSVVYTATMANDVQAIRAPGTK